MERITVEIACEVMVAIAAPVTPPNETQNIEGSSIVLRTAPIKILYMERLGLPSVRAMLEKDDAHDVKRRAQKRMIVRYYFGISHAVCRRTEGFQHRIEETGSSRHHHAADNDGEDKIR